MISRQDTKWMLLVVGVLMAPATAHSQQDETARILQRADSLFAHHRYAATDSLVTAVLQIQPTDRQALLRKARLHIQQWRLPDALRTLQRTGTPDGPDERYLL